MTEKLAMHFKIFEQISGSFVFPVEKYFPAWAFPEEHPLVQAGLAVRGLIGLAAAPASKWNFSTNGIYWAGKAGIPSIGFGPGEEETAHTVMDSVLLDDVVKGGITFQNEELDDFIICRSDDPNGYAYYGANP